MLVVILKFFHYLALFVAGGIGIGGAVISSAHQKAQQPPGPHVGKALQLLGYLGLGSILVLWATGFGLAYMIYGTMNIGMAFHIKLLGATALLVSSALANYHLYRASQAKQPPNGAYMKRLMMIGRGGLVLVLGGIAVTTTL